MALTYHPNDDILNEIKTIQANLGELYIELENLSEEEKSYIHQQALISNIGASTRIENAVLTDQEIEWMDIHLTTDSRPTAFEQHKDFILDKLSKDKQRSIEEVAGCREMLQILYSSLKDLTTFTETDIRALHKYLMNHYHQASHYAGRYKIGENKVVMVNNETGEKKIVLQPSSPGPITEAAMRDLVEWYHQTLNESNWPLLIASEFTFRFLAIHPFQDGNGRMSRALFTLILLQSADKYISEVSYYLAIDRHIEQNRASYYLALRECSNGIFQQDPTKYNLEPIVTFFVKNYRKSLSDIKTYREKYKKLKSLQRPEKEVLDCFKSLPEKTLQVKDIVTQTSISRRTIQNSIKSLVEKEFLQKLGSGPGTHYQLVF